MPLTKEIRDLRGVALGVRYDAGRERDLADNLVIATILCDKASAALSDRHFVFLNQLTSPEMSVRQLAEALGDDNEHVEVDLASVPVDVARIVLVIYVNEGIARRRSLGQLRSCIVRVLQLRDNQELVRSENLATGLTHESALSLGELYRHGPDWKFKVLGERYTGVAAIAADFKVPM